MPGFSVRDSAHKVTRALPNGAAAVTSNPIDLGVSSRSDFVANCEILLSAPTLGATPLPNSKTMIYDILHSDAENMADPVVIGGGILVQTGAGGTGDVAKTARFRPPTNVKRYVAVRATGSASGDATGASCTLELLF